MPFFVLVLEIAIHIIHMHQPTLTWIHGTAMWCACDKGPCISFNMLLNQMAQHSKKRFKQLQVQKKNTHIHKKSI